MNYTLNLVVLKPGLMLLITSQSTVWNAPILITKLSVTMANSWWTCSFACLMSCLEALKAAQVWEMFYKVLRSRWMMPMSTTKVLKSRKRKDLPKAMKSMWNISPVLKDHQEVVGRGRSTNMGEGTMASGSLCQNFVYA
uniref:Uncharacterized protein n=1 Tax=Solanum lycopersicum TaxID=4081 RepID=A0A3Q7G0K1_SOLLC